MPHISATKVGTVGGADIYRPIVIVRIEAGTGAIEGPALVDSGADGTLVPADILVPLGIDFSKLKKGVGGIGVGGGLETRLCKGRILYGKTVICEPTFTVAEPGKLKSVLLGRSDFFTKFVTRFQWHKIPPAFDVDPVVPKKK